MDTRKSRTYQARGLLSAVVGAAIAACAAGATAAGFAVYPDAATYVAPDTPQTRSFALGLPEGMKRVAYLTHDPYEKVLAFYLRSGKEYVPPTKPEAKGRQIKRSVVIFDGAPEPVRSHEWASIQTPFTGIPPSPPIPGYEKLDDVTVIVLTHRDAPKKPEKRHAANAGGAPAGSAH